MKTEAVTRCRAALAAILVVGSISCGKSKPVKTHRYELKGKVHSVDKQIGQATIEHEDIKDFMPGMTMPFNVKEKWTLNVMEPGDEITATLVIEDGRSWLEGIVVVKGGAPAGANRPGQPAPGDEVPDFALVDHNGKLIRFHQYRGKTLLLTFIYTRCPLPDYCPLMTSNFAEIHRSLKEAALLEKAYLLCVSIDPEYDKPAVLKAYGSEHAPGFDHWGFASGSSEQVRAVADYFGLEYRTENDQVIHNLVTALIDPEGKVRKLYSGNQWKPAEVLADLRSSL
jgi:protein SCO1/2